MNIKDVMTSKVEFVAPDCTLFSAAQKMRDLDVGAIPVCDGKKVSGIITDRDITVRGIAEGLDASQVHVNKLMSGPIAWVFEDDAVETAAQMMQEKQVRRLLVVDRNKRMVGMISLGDLATSDEPQISQETLQKVSSPTKLNINPKGKAA